MTDENTDKDEYRLNLIRQGYQKKYMMLPNGIYGEIWVSDDPTKDAEMDFSQVLSLVTTISTGLIMAIIRCLEPYFLFICRKLFYMIYGIPWTIEDEQDSYGKLDDTINILLNSSLNIELVHIILKSITDDCKNSERLDVTTVKWSEIYNNFEQYNVKEKHDYYEIEIEDPDKWAIDQFEPENKEDIKDEDNNEKKIITVTEDIEVIQLAPDIFNCIRRVDNVTNEDIIKSLNPNDNREMAFKAGEGSGKSGSFFFFSHDRNFIIKTMTDGEYQTFEALFKSYMYHLMTHKDSILARIYGIFTVKIEKLEPVHLIMMANTVQSMWNKMELKYMFDLKGSLINRETKINMKKYKPGMTLKDINLLNIRKDENLLKFSAPDRAKIMSIIEEDAKVLQRHDIMDYSLLLAVEKSQVYNYRSKGGTEAGSMDRPTFGSDGKAINHTLMKKDSMDVQRKRGNTANNDNVQIRFGQGTTFFSPTRHRFLSYNGEYVYHLAIIDYLQEYNWDKKSEHYAKTIFRGSGAEISAVPPERYMKRYVEFMRNEVIIDDRNRGSKSQTSS